MLTVLTTLLAGITPGQQSSSGFLDQMAPRAATRKPDMEPIVQFRTTQSL